MQTIRRAHINLPRLIRTLPLAVLSLCLLGSPAQAADPSEGFPNRALNITVTFPPGGGTDILARLIGNALAETLGHAAVVENKPGASGNVGSKYVAERAPDGYSLLMVNSSFAINPAVFTTMPFDPKKDFAPIINVAFIPSVLVVPANSPYQTLAALLTAAKPVKNDVSYGSCGNGTPQHLAGESLNIYAKAHITHIPYGGCGPALKDVVGGQIPLAIITASSAMSLIKGGKLRALAVTSSARFGQLPDVPTVAEQGYPGYELSQWHGLLAPANTPVAVQQKLFEGINKALQSPAVKDKLNSLGYTTANDGPAVFKKIIDGDIDKFVKLAKEIKLKVD
ncbi:MAG: ABC transporter substrate-binding protein [Alcaligenaceae bacterium]|nr:MAG: ABC transporter substrate-binding protein [Alcaligenaceae bacterium]